MQVAVRPWRWQESLISSRPSMSVRMFVAVLSLRCSINSRRFATVSFVPERVRLRTPLPSALSVGLSTTSASSWSLPASSCSKTETAIGSLMTLAAGRGWFSFQTIVRPVCRSSM